MSNKLHFTFPLYALSHCFQEYFVVGGGGGASRTGIPNKIVVLKRNPQDNSLSICAEIDTETFPAKYIAIQPNNGSSKFNFSVSMEDFTRIYSFSDNKIKLIASKQTEFDADSFAKSQCLAFFNKGSELATAGGDCQIRSWAFPEMKLIQTIQIEETKKDSPSITELIVDPSEKFIIAATSMEWSAWDIKTKKLIYRHTMTEKFSNSSVLLKGIVFSKQGDILYSGKIVPGKRGWLCKWKITMNQDDIKFSLSRTSISHRNYHHTCLSISPDSLYLATGTAENTIAVFDTSFSRLMEVRTNEFFVTRVAFSVDSSCVISVGADYSCVCTKIKVKKFPLEKLIRLVSIVLLIWFLYSYLLK